MSEKELIDLLKSGDRNAFNILVEQYQQKVISIAYGMLSDTDDALDASQEVFINVYKGIGSFKENSSLSTWIYRICSNVCKDFLRKRMRKTKTVSIDGTDEDDNAITQIPDSTHSPETLSEQEELRREIRLAMEDLSEEYKTVLVLCDIEGMSYDEIAVILKCPVGTIKSRLNRARQALRKKISEKRELFSPDNV